MIDCHTHTNFSTDSKQDIVEACEAAIAAGLDGIAFTDHLDVDYPGFEDEFYIDFTKYSKVIDELKTKYSGKLKIIKGLEIGMQPHVIEETYKRIENINFDFIIGSTHIVQKEDPYYDGYFKNRDKFKGHRDYLEEILKNLQLYDDFDVLGHLDYVKRYGSFEDKTLLYHDHSDVIDEILKILVKKGKGMEVNAGGFRYKLSSPLPDIEIFKRFKNLGGETVTIGTDAHSAEYVGKFMKETAEFLKSAGFSYAAYFENRKPFYYEI